MAGRARLRDTQVKECRRLIAGTPSGLKRGIVTVARRDSPVAMNTAKTHVEVGLRVVILSALNLVLGAALCCAGATSVCAQDLAVDPPPSAGAVSGDTVTVPSTVMGEATGASAVAAADASTTKVVEEGTKWMLLLLAGNAFDRGHESLSPNGAAVGAELSWDADAAFQFGGEARLFFGHRGEDAFGDDQSRMRIRLGSTMTVRGMVGDFDLRLGLAFGPLVEVGTTDPRQADVRLRWYMSPALTALRQLSELFVLGGQLRYTSVFEEVDALELLLVAGARFDVGG